MTSAQLDWTDSVILAPLTKGGNLPYRRLCSELGAAITTSEMAYARQIVRGSRSEQALLRSHPAERCFGVQIAATKPEDAVKAGHAAVEAGARFVDLNCGCPIHDVVRRGMGATLLRRASALERIVKAMVDALSVPVTVKIRAGWNEGSINALDIGQRVAGVGASALVVHGRTREQRYSRAADWALIGQLVEALPIPVIGNGDLLTHYEVADRRAESGCAGVMLARGALIKPWLFREVKEGAAWSPTPEERLAIYRRLCVYMREHFGDDERGEQRVMRFLPWHFDFFCRYRPLPEAEWRERSREHPLIQTRIPGPTGGSVLDAVLADPRPEMHADLAAALWASTSDENAVERCTALAETRPPEVGDAADIKTAHG